MSDAVPDLTKLRIERTPARSGGGSRWLLWIILAAVVVLILLVARGPIASMLDSRPVVEVATVLKTGGEQSVSGTAANGYVVARRQAALSTDIQGRIVELRVEEGDKVKAGDVIARLDTRQLEATLARSKAELATARATAELTRLDLQRKEPLLKSGDVSTSEVDAARAARDEADATALSLEAAVKETEVMITNSSVYAPFDGVITQKNAEVGEVVSSMSGGANSRAAVATLVDFETLEVQVELAQTSLRAAREGAPVMIYLDAFPDHAYRGHVRQIWPTADRQKATVELRAVFDERDGRILPEMGVRVVFLGEDEPVSAEPVVLVPARALAGEPPPAVFVLRRDGKVQRQEVEVGPANRSGLLPVAKGLSGGESVVLDPPASLKDGDAVRLPEEKE